jgi:DNA-binding Lrp family transcriptional regulator
MADERVKRIELEVTPDDLKDNYTLLSYAMKDLERRRKGLCDKYREILWVIAANGGSARHSLIAEATGIAESTLSDDLKKLEDRFCLVVCENGIYRLRRKTPLCFLAGVEEVPYAYVGLLGMPPVLPKEGEKPPEPETATAIRHLREEIGKSEIAEIVVATTSNVQKKWDDFLDKYESTIGTVSNYRQIKEIMDKAKFKMIKDLEDRSEVRKMMEQEVDRLTKEYITILDCTAGPRPAGWAYIQLAEKYKTPLIYVFYDRMTGGLSLRWEIGQKELEEGLAFMIPDKERREKLKNMIEGIKGKRKTRMKEKELTR